MTRLTTLVTLVGVGLAALMIGASAASADPWGKDMQQAHVDFWNYDQQTGKKISNTSPGIAPEELASLYGVSSDLTVPTVYPDAFERAAAQGNVHGAATTAPPDAFERAAGVHGVTSSEQALTVRGEELNRQNALGAFTKLAPDAFERTALSQGTTSSGVISGDDRVRIDPASLPTLTSPSTSPTSGTAIEWPQVGIGLGLGIALMLGVVLALRATRIRQLAH